jgi:hypothetical protein
MTPTGVLNIDFNAKEYMLSMTLVSIENVKFDCVNSRSGPYKKEQAVTLYIGTSVPGEFAPLPFTDAAHLTARYTLMPTAETKGESIAQVWKMDLTR